MCHCRKITGKSCYFSLHINGVPRIDVTRVTCFKAKNPPILEISKVSNQLFWHDDYPKLRSTISGVKTKYPNFQQPSGMNWDEPSEAKRIPSPLAYENIEILKNALAIFCSKIRGILFSPKLRGKKICERCWLVVEPYPSEK